MGVMDRLVLSDATCARMAPLIIGRADQKGSNGVIKDKAAINAAITTSSTNGQTEGQITKLKLVGRAKLDLLQARLIGAK